MRSGSFYKFFPDKSGFAGGITTACYGGSSILVPIIANAMLEKMDVTTAFKILGAVMMCARASDLIGEFADAVVSGLKLSDMGRVVRPHPSFSEGITEVCRQGGL